MVVKSWEVKEQFCFPQSFGKPKGVKAVNVTPQYIHRNEADAIEVNGIYHITCHVEFEEGEVAHHATSEFTQIEDLDLQGDLGYFEYAVPMSVEVSKEKIPSECTPKVSVQEIDTKAEQDGIEIMWVVNFEYETSKPVMEPGEKLQEKTMESSSRAPIVLESSSSSSSAVEIFESSNKSFTEEVVLEASPKVEKEEPRISVTETNVEGPSFDSELEFIHSLEDGYTKVTFPSNNVFEK